jgi:hypothetical protein
MNTVDQVTWGSVVFLLVVMLIEVAGCILVGILAWKWFWVAMQTVKPVHIDGVLYVCIAVFVFMQSWFSSDDAYKYVNPFVIFWIKGICGTVGAAAGALKMFRSTGYSDSLKDKQNVVDNPPKPPDAPKV